MNYQRSRGIDSTGTIGPETWTALLLGKDELPDRMPSECTGPGVNICVSKAHRKMYWVKDGSVVKTFPVRLGGFNTDKEGRWVRHETVAGTYKVFKKDANPCSPRYGCNSMPYSTMFHPDMYIHYSSGFASEGYSGSSHGCVNIRSLADAKWIMTNTPIGATVRIYST